MQFTLERTPYGSPVAQELCAEVQAEYAERYGDEDVTPLTETDFEPPNGEFVVAYDETGAAVGCGGWRTESEAAEMKRLYVRRAARRQGLARILVTAIERSAADAGRKRLILVTGRGQPEAIALYESIGYRPVEPYSLYADEPDAVHLGKELGSQRH